MLNRSRKDLRNLSAYKLRSDYEYDQNKTIGNEGREGLFEYL